MSRPCRAFIFPRLETSQSLELNTQLIQFMLASKVSTEIVMSPAALSEKATKLGSDNLKKRGRIPCIYGIIHGSSTSCSKAE